MKCLKVSFISAALLCLAACGSLQTKDDATIVSELSAERIAALKAADYEKAYSLMSPGYRSVNTLAQYRGTHAGGAALLHAAKVDSAKCTEDTCRVMVNAQYYFRSSKLSLAGKPPLLVDRVNAEEWVKVDGKWWYVRLK